MPNVRDTHVFHYARSKLRRGWQSEAQAQQSGLFNTWWFYGAELFPGVVKQGIFPNSMPLPARMLLRNCNLTNADCLDIGSMEGLIPILMCKQGARRVVATDFNFHCYQKMAALQRLHGVDFNFKKIGLLYDLANKISSSAQVGYDLINLSGVLYHVFSPLHVMAGLRPLLKKDGLMIVSTNVIERDDVSMEFNNGGKLQTEANTFWYLSIRMFEYMLHYFQMVPIDFVYHRYPNDDTVRYSRDYKSGYLSVVCRAVNDRGASFNDKWLSSSISEAWEYLLCNQKLLESQKTSTISYKLGEKKIDLALQISEQISEPEIQLSDTHLLRLSDIY